MTDPVEIVAEELAKKLPVDRIYDDAASGAVKQLGHALTDVIKTIRLALVPFQLGAAYQDRLTHFIDQSVRRVPEERQISPVLQILGPVLEGIRYEPMGTEIEAMFSELLSRAIDRDRVVEAHPSYPGIIRQLSPDEARLLVGLRSGDLHCCYRLYWPTEPGPNSGVVDQRIVDDDDLAKIELAHRSHVDFYFQHLSILGLASSHKEFLGELPSEEIDGKIVRRGSRHRRSLQLTDFGRHFVKACAGE